MPERRPTKDLTPYGRNARTHSPAQVEQIIASIREFGFTNPILINAEGAVIAGHARLAAAIQMGLPDVPVIVLDHLSKAQQRAYIIADNKLALNAGWDDGLLKLELVDLQDQGFDLGVIGFDEHELARILRSTEGLTDPDDVPDVQADAVSASGDLWRLGAHRLLCGDATSATDVARVLAGARPHLMVTDPPWGVEYDAAWRDPSKVAQRPHAPAKRGAFLAAGPVVNDDRSDWLDAWALFRGDVAYVWCSAGPLQCVVHDNLQAAGLEIRMQIVWAKSQAMIGRGHYHSQHESCWYAVRKGRTGHWQGDRTQTTIWNINSNSGWATKTTGPDARSGHSTQKPVECMRRPIENNSRPGETVYEPFSGSGTTIIAGEMTARRVLALEIHPQYVDLAVRRWEAFTGEEATREADGASFADAARASAREAVDA